MKPIQVILVVLSLQVAILASFVFRHRIVARMLILCSFLAAIILIVFPQIPTSIRLFFGLNRTADLVVYAILFGEGFAFLVLSSQTARLEKKFNECLSPGGRRDLETIEVAVALPESHGADSRAIKKPVLSLHTSKYR